MDRSAQIQPLTGRCLCGAVTYEVHGEPSHVQLCHCTDCRRHGGGPAALLVVVDRESLDLAGETRWFATFGDRTGRELRRHFCPACGTGLLNDPPGGPKVGLRGGALDDPAPWVPQREIWCDSALPWMPEVPGIQRLSGEEFIRAAGLGPSGTD